MILAERTCNEINCNLDSISDIDLRKRHCVRRKNYKYLEISRYNTDRLLEGY